ncbi:hypothetical protein DNTS_031291 [Danionella cerebrum]|uniref:Uncharacterized protein n=1 Tax=Danionella cerebrum TaxID=2873325 RepID=A0A553Q5X5_9TELE|nr:hypothetical protein DNTS_031291 [Danionella translucida]
MGGSDSVEEWKYWINQLREKLTETCFLMGSLYASTRSICVLLETMETCEEEEEEEDIISSEP